MNELCNNFIKLASVYPMAPNSQNWLRNKFLNQKKNESLNITKFTQTHRKTRLLATSFFFFRQWVFCYASFVCLTLEYHTKKQTKRKIYKEMFEMKMKCFPSQKNKIFSNHINSNAKSTLTSIYLLTTKGIKLQFQ